LKVEGEEERNWSLVEADIRNLRSEAGGRTETKITLRHGGREGLAERKIGKELENGVE
jgi:hypothetical protein